ncbi:hypothetical protein B9Z55_007070 [Caenorhabditis nigoni]|uniref:Ubiquitin-like domain-containing protein n=1 Tax=Caenorhabditis nigoni TaxID=1611254 RepID=A0A2G5V829_9PELO|nr:hypothetical protein B9Z55_007070 [Caenorhabditis nigoni]
MSDTNKILLSKIQALQTGLHELTNIVIENLTPQKSQQDLTEEHAECRKVHESQNKLLEHCVAVNQKTLLELENSRKVQKQQKEEINILKEDNEKFIEIRRKLNEENDELREELRRLKQALEDIEGKKTFQIFIRDRKTICLDVKKFDTIEDVKEKMFKRGFPCGNCFLTYAGKHLNDTHTLFYYDIQKESTLFVHFRKFPDHTQ